MPKPGSVRGGAASLPADVGDNTYMSSISPARDGSVTHLASSPLLIVYGVSYHTVKDGQNA
jgi:hypothetical protein